MATPADNWMIYGATGYTGQLVAEFAIQRGHRPVLAGRNEEKLRPLAERLDLPYRAFSLDETRLVGESIADMDLVYHAAGPFVYTAQPMMNACLATKTHYLDITGELNILSLATTYDTAASKNGIAIISGAGFDVVPTDCMAKYVSQQLPGATHLDIAFAGFSGVSAGTTKSLLEFMHEGMQVRRDGKLQTIRAGTAINVTFPFGDMPAVAISWGDLATAYRSTQIPNITTCMAVPRVAVTGMALGFPLVRFLMKSQAMRRLVGRVVESAIVGPDQHLRDNTHAYVYARAYDDAGHLAEAWLKTVEPYRFTSEIAIHAVEHCLEHNPTGALTPSLAFGTDFVLRVEGSERYDTLPEKA